MTSLAGLVRVRSGAALSLIAYLKATAETADELPSYFPDRMHDGSRGWFTVVRQKVHVRNRLPGEPRPGLGRAHDDGERDGGQDPEWGGPEIDAWPRIVVFGEPGAGKSWLLRFDELRLGLGWQDVDARTKAVDSIVLPIRVTLADVATVAAAPTVGALTDSDRAARVTGHLVTRVFDRALVMLRRDPANFSGPARAAVAEDVIRFQGLRTPPESFKPLVRAALDGGRALVMLDAWDEVPTGCDRQELARHVSAFASTFKGRLVVTSREAEFPKEQESTPLPGAVLVDLRPLMRPQIEAFSQAWFGAHQPDVTKRFIEQLDADRGQVFELGRNPLMLTLMCRLYGEPRPFPTHRVKIYDRCVDGLLCDWKRTWQPRPGAARRGTGYVRDLSSVLAHLASTLLSEPAPYPAARVVRLVEEALARLTTRHPNHALKDLTVDDVLREICDDGVLLPVDDRRDAYRFLHRTFHEYFAGVELVTPAVALASATPPDDAGAVGVLTRAVTSRQSESEVVLLALGYVALVTRDLPPGKGPELVGRAIERMLDVAAPDDRFEVLALLGRAVAELGEDGAGAAAHTRVTTEVRNALRGHGADAARMEAGPVTPVVAAVWAWLHARFFAPATLSAAGRQKASVGEAEAAEQSRQRARFGDVLGRIGDTRFHSAERWHLPDDVKCGWTREPADDQWAFVKIAGGTLLMGDDGEADERPQHRVPVQDFYLARWPVTEQQFGLFVQATSHDAGSEWERGKPNHPVVNVSWHDAMAYCGWLRDEWRRERARLPRQLRAGVDAGWAIVLPSEAEWEWAARGPRGRCYPCGGTIGAAQANFGETGIQNTSAVGCFPLGATPLEEGGIEELSGNVWEWTRSEFKEYKYAALDGPQDVARDVQLRVLLGGSFNFRWFVRCASGLNLEPGARNRFSGFRVVLSPFAFDPPISDPSGL